MFKSIKAALLNSLLFIKEAWNNVFNKNNTSVVLTKEELSKMDFTSSIPMSNVEPITFDVNSYNFKSVSEEENIELAKENCINRHHALLKANSLLLPLMENLSTSLYQVDDWSSVSALEKLHNVVIDSANLFETLTGNEVIDRDGFNTYVLNQITSPEVKLTEDHNDIKSASKDLALSVAAHIEIVKLAKAGKVDKWSLASSNANMFRATLATIKAISGTTDRINCNLEDLKDFSCSDLYLVTLGFNLSLREEPAHNSLAALYAKLLPENCDYVKEINSPLFFLRRNKIDFLKNKDFSK